MMAVHGGAVRVAQLLLEAGSDPNHRNKDGRTALHFVADSVENTRLLLDKGAQVNAADRGGMTPVCFAGLEVRALLLKRGAKQECLTRMCCDMLARAISDTGSLIDWKETSDGVTFRFGHVQLLLRSSPSILTLHLRGLRSRPPTPFPSSCWLRQGALRLLLDRPVTLELQGYGHYVAEDLVLEDAEGPFGLLEVESRNRGWWEAWKAGELGNDPAGQITIPLG